jgi:8-oxo-dGTP pyrophosphatase MutT (NUDIX family)
MGRHSARRIVSASSRRSIAAPAAMLLAHPELHRLAHLLAQRPGAALDDLGAPVRWAAVAILLRVNDRGRLDLLLIRRADREGDPWSGHVALPGGRRDPEDASLEETALREVWEEVGVDVRRDGRVIGTLDDLAPHSPTLPPMAVRPFVAVVADAPLAPNPEVASASWIPLDALCAAEATRDSVVLVRGQRWTVPSFVVGDYLVWGMTERILRQFVSLL